MIAAKPRIPSDIKHPINLASDAFVANKYAYYWWLREAPVYRGKLAFIMDAFLLARYADCVSLLKDPRFLRNRTTATGAGCPCCSPRRSRSWRTT